MRGYSGWGIKFACCQIKYLEGNFKYFTPILRSLIIVIKVTVFDFIQTKKLNNPFTIMGKLQEVLKKQYSIISNST